MRFGRKLRAHAAFAASPCLLAACLVVWAGDWIEHQPVGAVLDVLLRSVPMPGGVVRFRRPPAETRPALTKMLGAEPKNAALYRLRAQEDEMQADFAAAESDWKVYADLAADRGAGYLELADFYQRRARSVDEVGALQVAGQALSDPYKPVKLQRAWAAYERMLPAIKDAGLPVASTGTAFRSWIAKYPQEPTPRREFVNFLIEQKQYAAAEAQIAAYDRAFPEDGIFPVEARANVAAKRDSEDAALRVYDKAFRPLWAKELKDAYFALLDKNEELREFLGRARTARDKNPVDLEATGRLFAYYQHVNNAGAARRVLLEYRLAKEAKPDSWTADELKTMALLFDDSNERARMYYALYSLPGAAAADRETALAGIVDLLLNQPEQQIRFGSGDLSLYKDIATLDSSPGFLNGILSLVLNSTSPRWQYEQSNAAAGGYFHRAEGARLLELLEKQFPASPHRTALRASLVDAYASYGDDADAIAAGRAFLTAFPKAGQRTHVAMAVADALARRGRNPEEFAVYQQMLAELAGRFGGVPLGPYGGAPAQPGQVRGPIEGLPGPRSPEYAEVLDKYLARLSALNQPMEALRVYRRELDRDPNDPGLYERFGGFLEANNLGSDVQDVYRRAIAKFPDKSWYDKLARWYLRGKQQAAFTALSREATGIFSGTELEVYFQNVVNAAEFGPALYLQLNLYAHQRFPEDLAFVRNLWGFYVTQGTADSAAATALLHDYWFYDADFKRQYFEQLSARGQLLSQIAAVQKTQTDNPAAVQLNAEAEAWLGHFEAAAAGFRATAELYPGSVEKNATTASLYRSLAAYYPADTQVAAGFARKAYEAYPPDTRRLETVGDVYSDREDFTRAVAAWNTIPTVFPGKPDGYLEKATVLWDYYRFDDSLKVIREARVKFRNPALYAYEAGAIEEGRRDYPRAVAEYLAGWKAGNQTARTRIVRLASRPAQRDLVYRLTADADAALRIDVLKAQQRKPELEAFLAKEITVATRVADIGPLINAAREQGLSALEQQGLERQIAVTLDPVERMRMRIELAKYLEGRKDIEGAARAIEALYRDNPLILGVVRARVDFDKRNKRDADAISALTEAAGKARPDLSAQFRFEAARVATEAGRIEQARGLLTELLKAEPYREDYLAGMAETYAAAKDDAGFVSYAGAEIEALKKAPLAGEDRKTKIAALRRRLIPTLARRGDYAGAVDQYIEVVNAYPDDKDVAREAALFAGAHGRREQLVSFYTKTIATSPRDWRWPIVLARLQTVLEDYPAALSAYDTAMKARPDRADLVQARAELEERLLRFEDAIKSYTRLYALTYNDAQWLDKAAEFQARLGRGAEAVATLEKAHIGAGGETVSGLFAIAEYLDQWHLSEDAARFAQRGFALAGKDMAQKYPAELVVYARIMAGARRDDAVLALDAKETNAIRTAGFRIAERYTPEEKAALAGRPGVGQTLAESAGFEDRVAQLLSGPNTQPAWIALQSRRGLYEQIAAVAPPQQAATAAANAGDWATEMRSYARWQALGTLGGASLDRYLRLLLEHDPAGLVAQRSDRAVQIAILAGNQDVAMQALKARAAALSPLWLSSYTALTGVYFDDRSAGTNQAFVTALHPQTIGQRLAAKADPDRFLVGSIWFDYGARYGEYLANGGAADAGDYLPASVEAAPGNADAYVALGEFETRAKLWPAAIAEFRKALDLDANRGEAHDGIARVYMAQGRREDAIAEWRESMSAFQREQSRGVRVRDSFWAHVNAAIGAMAEAKVFAELQPDIHRLLANYAHINGDYRFGELIRPTLEASYRNKTGFEWLLDLNSDVFIQNQDSDEQEWLAQYRIALAARRGGNDSQVAGERSILIDLLLAHGKEAEALAEWRRLTPEEVERLHRNRSALEIQVAGAEGTIEQLIARYKAEPANQFVSYLPEMVSSAQLLRQHGHVAAALSLLEFAYTRELEQQHLVIANFLGLARVYLERGNQLDQAMALLQRMTLVAGQPFEAFEPAGDLLAEFHRDAEARGFYAKAVQAAPWNASARLDLRDRAGLLHVVGDTTAPYALRAEAARAVAPAQVPVGGELALLASGDRSAEAARKPFFVEARLAAAANASDASVRLSLLREALAIAPDNPRVRQAAVGAAIEAHNDHLALAMHQVSQGPVVTEDQPDPEYNPYLPYQAVAVGDPNLRALAGAAERTGDLGAAVRFLQSAGGTDARARIAALQAEQKRRAGNAKRQPIITNKLEQPQIVRARILP